MSRIYLYAIALLITGAIASSLPASLGSGMHLADYNLPPIIYKPKEKQVIFID